MTKIQFNLTNEEEELNKDNMFLRTLKESEDGGTTLNNVGGQRVVTGRTPSVIHFNNAQGRAIRG